MGITLSQEQADRVLEGTAICNNRYWAAPVGCAVQLIYGVDKLQYGKPCWHSAVKGFCWCSEIRTAQTAPAAIARNLGATDLYNEFLSEVYGVTSTWHWRKEVLRIRSEYAPRFFALGMDVYICGERTGGKDNGHNEYWCLFVDRAVAPNFTPPSSHLLWGMGTGFAQQEMAPIIQQYLAQSVLRDTKEPPCGDIPTTKDDMLPSKGGLDDAPPAYMYRDAPPVYSMEDSTAQV